MISQNTTIICGLFIAMVAENNDELNSRYVKKLHKESRNSEREIEPATSDR